MEREGGKEGRREGRREGGREGAGEKLLSLPRSSSVVEEPLESWREEEEEEGGGGASVVTHFLMFVYVRLMLP